MLFGLLSGAMAQMQWVDVTDSYIRNPRFDNNDRTTGWSGTSFGAANPKENAEFYDKNYDAYQVLTGLAKGRYRLSVKAFYRMGDSNSDYIRYSSGNYSAYQYAKLYATSSTKTFETSIVPISSGMVSSSLGGGIAVVGGWNYIPNNMEAAYYWFQAGYYSNSVECQVDSDGRLRIGVRKNSTLTADWSCFDDFKLEHYTTIKNVTEINISATSVKMIPTEMQQLTATVVPEDATYKTVMWSSSHSSVVAVNSKGVIKAMGVGTATITATSKDSGKKTGTITITVVPAGKPSAESVVINEVMAANVDVYRDPSTNYGSWVELYNPTDDGIVLGGLTIEMTDADGIVSKHKLKSNYGVLPAHGFAVLNFDHYEQYATQSYRQIDDKLDCDGGTIRILNGTDELASFTYPAAKSRLSYGRTEDGGTLWRWTGNPTPSATNATSQFALTQLPAPVVDKAPQLFTGSLTCRVTIPAGTTLRYTTDGSAPTMENGYTATTGVFTTSSSKSYRFRLYQDGMLPSPVVTRTFIYNSGNEPFPIISLTSASGEIFDGGEYAIFAQSANGRAGRGQSGMCNWNMEWDRPVNFDYITTNNECVVSQEVNLSACGGWSRAWTPHSFKLKANKQYGINYLSTQFFAEKPFLKHKVLQIRNGGNDTGARIKDPALQQIVARSGMNVEYQSWQPVHVFMNGQPYAVLNMREPNNKDYGESNYGIDDDLMDQFEICPDSGYVQMRGTKEAFMRLYNLSKTASTAASYEEIKTLLDIENFVNYMAVELYLGCTDWPQNNVKAFRSVSDGKFRFVLFDLDGALATDTPLSTFMDKRNYTFDYLYGYDYSLGRDITGLRITKENEVVTIFQNMLNNSSFKKKFIDAFCLVAGSVYTPERVNSIVDEMANYLSQGGYVYPSNTANDIRNRLGYRQSTLVNHLKSYFSLGTAKNVTFGSNIESAGILLNGVDVPTGKFSGQLFMPVTLTAKAPAGYEFLGWKDNSGTTTGTETVIPLQSTWRYFTTSLDGKAWKSASYGDGSWGSGKAPLGYGKSQNNTNNLAANKSCYYFRKTVTLSNVSSDDVFKLNYTVDDGMVVYVNGTEAGRYNMPNGTPTYSTVASSYAQNNPDMGTMTLNASLFKTGTNVIAVEVHNNSTSSSDIMWEASLTRNYKNVSDSYITTSAEYQLTGTETQDITAVWRKIEGIQQRGECDVPIKINEVSAQNDSYVDENIKKGDWVELYNTTDTDLNVAGLYISDNASKPTKFQIAANGKANTIIPAHGHLIVWCTKKYKTDTQLHATFNLGNDDGSVVMISSSADFEKNNKAFFDAHPQMKNFKDVISYNAHTYDQSVGRYPDGGNAFFLMNKSTICKSNILQNADSYVGADDTFVVGDADGDGKITKADAHLIVQKYLGEDVNINVNAADINNDGKVSMPDANEITNMAE